MTPIQQLMLGVGAKKKVYLDDVFSTDLWKGDGSAHQVVNNIDLSGEGGMVWTKARSAAEIHLLTDTVRSGTNPTIFPNESVAEQTGTDYFSSINNNGFTTGTWAGANGNNTTFAGWTFRKAPGFFDVVTWTGNGSNRTIAHSLGCVPGLIMIKNVSASENWRVYHRATKATHNLQLNDTDAAGASSTPFNNTEPTASVFSVGTDGATNGNGQTIVAYLFAGGESTAATARSLTLDASGDYLTTGSSTDYAMGTGDFTVEGWFKINSGTNYGLFMNHSSGLTTSYGITTWYYTDYGLTFKGGSGTTHQTGIHPGIGQWFHLALVRNSGTTSFYYNGTFIKSASDTTDYTGERFVIGGYHSASYLMNGSVSNFRVVKGTAVYTSSFRPPTEPLTSITNTKLLCCQSSTVEGCTTGTVSESGNITASTDSPFDDLAGFVFGEEGDQNVIKCGSYIGNGSDTGPEINLGFEPQWVLIKWTSSVSGNNEGWHLFDSMRGIVTGETDTYFTVNTNSQDSTGSDGIDLTPTGFKVKSQSDFVNNNGTSYIYMCIRRPDPLVQKPQLATDVFAMDTGNGSSTIPAFDSGFPVDFAIKRSPASSDDWKVTTRLTGLNVVKTNSTAAESSSTTFVYDSNVGWAKNQNSNDQGWMWKRHAGFDVVTYKGNSNAGGVFQTINHNLGKTPEMIWIKNRTEARDWTVGHKGLDGGTNPWQHYIVLNSTSDENGSLSGGVNVFWGNGSPNATHFNVGDWNTVNENNKEFIAMLFASVSGVSAVGSYTGNGSTTGPIITTGFQPRLIMLKRADDSGSWYLYDTLRGITSGNDHRIELNGNYGQSSGADDVDVLSTGFQLKHTWDNLNGSGGKYLYYAHA